MSMGTVGTLNIDMAVNVANLHREMQAARSSVEKAMAGIQRATGLAGTAFAALGVSMSVDAFARWIKGAIDAADKANEMSQKIGVAVKDMAGLQLAFQQGGIDADGMQKALAKLSVGIMDGNSALKAMGIATRNADGSLMSTREVIAQVADQFAGYQDGVAKTALAVELFGKSGADLIPVLNGGSAAFAEFDDWAKRLGMTLSEETAQAADRFNDTLDLLQLGTQGIAMGIAAGLLPTLQSLAGEFLTLMSDGQNLQVVIDLLAGSLKVLATGAIATLATFRSLSEFGQSVSAKIAAVMNGDFEAAKRIGEGFERANTEIWAKAGDSIDRIWNQTGNSAVAAMASMAAASKKAAPEIGKASEEAARAAKKQREEYEKAVKAAKDLVDSIRFETDTQKMSNVEKEIAINLRKLEQTGLQQNTEEYRAYADAIRQATIENEGIKERIKLEKEAADKRKKIEEDWAREVEQINFQIGQSLTDALVNGGKTAKEFLIDMFKTLILRPILQPIITGGTSIVTTMLGLGASGSAMANTGSLANTAGLGQLGSMASTLNSLYTGVASGFTAVSSAIGSGLAYLGAATESASLSAFAAGMQGASLAPGLAGPTTAGATGALGAGATAAAFTQGVAGIGAGVLAGEFISDGKSLIGGNSLWTTGGGAAAGAAIGTAVLPGIGTAIGGLIGGIVGGIANAGWGSGAKELQGSGMARGTITAGGLQGAEFYQNWKKEGGWFTSDKYGQDVSGMSAELITYINDASKAIRDSGKDYATLLQLSSEGIDGIALSFDFAVGSMEELTQNLGTTLDAYANKVADAILAGTDFAKSGETSYETIQRLVNSLNIVNPIFDTLGIKLYDMSAKGGAAASAFIDLMGGMDKFNESTDFFYQNFYSEAERTQKSTENLTKVFKTMNMELPANTQAFRALVDATAAAGNDQLLANLLQLAPAFMQISEAAGKSVNAIEQERSQLMTQLYQATGNTAMIRAQQLEKIDVSNRELQLQIWAIEDRKVQIEAQRTSTLKRLADEHDARVKSINAQKTATEAARQTAQEQVSELTTIFNTLGDAIASITRRFAASSVVANSFQFIDRALATARTTGYLPSSEDLSNAIAGATGSLGAENFATKFEMERANLVLAGKLQQLQEIGSDQKTIAEQQLEAATRQIEQLDAQLIAEQERYDAYVERANKTYDMMATNFANQIMAMYSVDSSVQGVTDAVNNMSLQFATYEQTKAAVNKIQGAFTSSSTAMAVAGAGLTSVPWASRGEFSQSGEAGSLNISGYKFEGDQLVSPNGQRVEFAGASPISKLMELYGLVAQSDGTYIRTRAMGGYTPPGMTLVGEQGPELVNFQNPAMVYNAAQTRSLMSGSEVAGEIKALREDNRTQARAMVQLQTRMNRIFERWDGDGIPETRNVTA